MDATEFRFQQLERKVKELEDRLQTQVKGKIILPPGLDAKPAGRELGFNEEVGEGRLEAFNSKLGRVVFCPFGT